MASRVKGPLPPKTPSKHSLPRRKSASRILFLVLLFGIPLGLITGCAYILFGVPFQTSGYKIYTDSCAPQHANGVFAPDVTFGNFTISEARAIDLSWNLIMGRGIQALMGFASYRIVTGVLLRMVETVPVTYGVFVALVFNTNTIVSIIPLMKSVSSALGFRFKATLIFLLLSAILILAMPTLMDISTGYIQATVSHPILPNNTRARDGCQWFDTHTLECTYPPSFYNVKTIEGLATLENGTQISAHGCIWFNTYTFTCASSRNDRQGLIELQKECIIGVGYQWGFSMAWFVALSSILVVWSIGMCGIWIETSHGSELQRKGIDMGKWKAIADLGKAMQHEFGPHLSQYADKDLERSISRAPPVKYTIEHDEETGQDRIELSSEPSERLRLSATNHHVILDQLAISTSKPLVIMRSLQLVFAPAEISLAVYAIEVHKVKETSTHLLPEMKNFNVKEWLAFTMACGIITVAIVVYDLTAKSVRAMRFIWATISLDIIVIVIRLVGIVRLRHSMETTNYGGGDTDEYNLPVVILEIKAALLATSVIGVILFTSSLALSSTDLDRFHRSCDKQNVECDINNGVLTPTSKSHPSSSERRISLTDELDSA